MTDDLREDADGAPYPPLIQDLVQAALREKRGEDSRVSPDVIDRVTDGLILLAEFAVSEPWGEDETCHWCTASMHDRSPTAHFEKCLWFRARQLMGLDL